jgi:hypothetical protein
MAIVFFGGKPGQSTALYLIRELRGFLLRRDSSAFAPLKRGLSPIHRRKDFSASPLLPLPQRQGFLESILLAFVAATLYSLADKGFLIRRQLHFHGYDPFLPLYMEIGCCEN